MFRGSQEQNGLRVGWIQCVQSCLPQYVKFGEIWMYVSYGIKMSPVIAAIAKLEER